MLYLHRLASAKMCSVPWVLAGFPLPRLAMSDAFPGPRLLSFCTGWFALASDPLNTYFSLHSHSHWLLYRHLACFPEAQRQKEFCGAWPPPSTHDGKQAQFSALSCPSPSVGKVSTPILEPLTNFSAPSLSLSLSVSAALRITILGGGERLFQFDSRRFFCQTQG